MPVALLERYVERDIVIRQGLGLTETSPTVFLTGMEDEPTFDQYGFSIYRVNGTK